MTQYRDRFLFPIGIALALLVTPFRIVGADVQDNSLYALAVAALSDGDGMAAVHEFKRLVKEEPAAPEAHLGLTAAYLKTGQPVLAREQAKLILSLPNVNFQILMHLEHMLVLSGEIQGAIDVLKAAEQRAPLTVQGEDRSSYFDKLLAALYSELQRNDEACRSLRQAIQKQPGVPENYYRLALLLIKTGRLAEAYEWASKAHSKFPDTSEITLSYALASFFSGHNENAETAYRQLVTSEPNSDEAYFAQGNFYEDVNRTAEAAQAFAAAARKNPQNYLNFYMYGVALFKLDRLTEAREAINKALSLKPGHPDSWYWLGRISMRLGKKEEALADFDKAITLEPRHLSAHYQLGVLYAQRGDQLKSKEMFRKWREINGLAEHNVVAEQMQ